MVYARRNRLPSHVKVNKCGAISLLSFIRGLDLDDGVVFKVEIDKRTNKLTLVPTELLDVPTN